VRKHTWLGTDPELIEIERRFTETLGTRVQISKTDFGGKLTIDYFAQEDLEKLLELMGKADITLHGSEERGNMLAKLAVATPLTAPALVAEPERETPVEPAYIGEEMFTRHDTLEEIMDPTSVEDRVPEPGNKSATPTNTPGTAPTPPLTTNDVPATEPAPKKEETNEDDLYSLKNLSL
jgi:hypothetical protein